MNRTIGPARLGFAAALLALLLGPLALGFHTAHAQGITSAAYYGTGLEAGATVAASVGGTECSSATVDADGGWYLEVSESDPCSPSDGDTVSFSVDGNAAEQTVEWEAGGSPADIVNGISLTVAEAMPGDGDDNGDAMPGDGDDVAMPDTGNAGLVTSSSSSSLAAVALAFLAVAGIAGARVATRRVS